MPCNAALASGFVLERPLLPAISRATNKPLAFTVLDVSNGLTTRGRAIVCRVADRGHGGFVAARPIAERKRKKIICVTTRGRNFGVFNGLGHNFSLLTAHLLCLSALGSDMGILAPFGLASRRLPAMDLPQALRLLAVALGPAPWLVLGLASLAQAASRARSACSGGTIVLSRTLAGAHGRCLLPRESPGGMCHHSPRALSTLE